MTKKLLEFRDYDKLMEHDEFFIWKDKLSILDTIVKTARFWGTKERIAKFFITPYVEIEDAEYLVFNSQKYGIFCDFGTSSYYVVELCPSTSVG